MPIPDFSASANIPAPANSGFSAAVNGTEIIIELYQGMAEETLRDKRMRESTDHIERAVRVLTALTNNRHPDPEDVAELRRFVPESAGKTIDEIVCEVIRKALKHHNPLNGNR